MNYSKKSAWQGSKFTTQNKSEEKILRKSSKNKKKAESPQLLVKEMIKKVTRKLSEGKETE